MYSCANYPRGCRGRCNVPGGRCEDCKVCLTAPFSVSFSKLTFISRYKSYAVQDSNHHLLHHSATMLVTNGHGRNTLLTQLLWAVSDVTIEVVTSWVHSISQAKICIACTSWIENQNENGASQKTSNAHWNKRFKALIDWSIAALKELKSSSLPSLVCWSALCFNRIPRSSTVSFITVYIFDPVCIIYLNSFLFVVLVNRFS